MVWGWPHRLDQAQGTQLPVWDPAGRSLACWVVGCHHRSKLRYQAPSGAAARVPVLQLSPGHLVAIVETSHSAGLLPVVLPSILYTPWRLFCLWPYCSLVSRLKREDKGKNSYISANKIQSERYYAAIQVPLRHVKMK